MNIGDHRNFYSCRLDLLYSIGRIHIRNGYTYYIAAGRLKTSYLFYSCRAVSGIGVSHRLYGYRTVSADIHATHGYCAAYSSVSVI